MNDSSQPPPRTPAAEGASLADTLRRLARVAAVFCCLTGGILLVQHYRAREADPFKSTEMAELKRQLAAAPKDEALKQRIRELDLHLRQRYFAHLRRSLAGGWLLLIGLAAGVASARRFRKLREQPHLPAFAEDQAERHLAAQARSRRAAGIMGVATAAGLVALAWGADTSLPLGTAVADGAAAVGEAKPATPRLPDQAAFLANWPRFLGPTGTAVSIHTNLPVRWDLESGENVLWKAPVPAPGFNSPIVWGDRVFLCGGNAERRLVLCYDAGTGALRWQKEVPAGPTVTQKQLKELEETGLSASSMATDGLRVYAVFATGDLAAFDLDGRPVWSKALGVPDDPYGHASSLVTHEGRLLLQWDQGYEEDEVSKLSLLDGATGEPVWETPRAFGASWTTPLIINAAGAGQIVTLGASHVVAYNLADGAERWRVDCVGGELTPSPIFAGGLVLATSPSDRVCAIRPDATGELSEDDLVWTEDEEVPDIATPVANEELLFTLATYGVLVCVDVKTGEKLWDHDLEMECNASPAIAGDRLYVFGTDGQVFVGRAAREFGELAKFEMGEPIHASPAFAPGRVFVRGESTLFALGAGGKSDGSGGGVAE